MVIMHMYFDWKGPRETVKEYGKKLEEACDKTSVKFWGVYSPTQDKWNFVAIFEAEELSDVVKPFREAGGWQENMTHAISKYFYKTYS